MSNKVYINNIASALPHDPVANDEVETRLGYIGGTPSRSRRIVQKQNGIRERYYAIDPYTNTPSFTNAELTALAIRKLENHTLNISDIECLVSSTTKPDQIAPNHAVMVHGELNIPECEAVSTSGICLCGLTALKYGYLCVKSGEFSNVVTSGSEISSDIMRSINFDAEYQMKSELLDSRPEIAFEKDFLRWMLSDGAGAVWLTNKPNTSGISLEIEWIETLSFANEQSACMYAGADKLSDGSLKGWTRFSAEDRNNQSVFSLKQDVKQLDKHIVELTVEKALKKIADKRGITPSMYDYFLPHYSSEYFREKLYQGLQKIDFEIPYERWFTNLSTKGNTGSASIYIMLEELFKASILRPEQRLLCYVPESGRFSSGFMQLRVV